MEATQSALADHLMPSGAAVPCWMPPQIRHDSTVGLHAVADSSVDSNGDLQPLTRANTGTDPGVYSRLHQLMGAYRG